MTISRIALGVFLLALPLTASALEFKLATLSPNGSTWMNSLQSAAKEISARTNDRVTFKFYGGGVMGDDNVVLRKIRVRQLHGAIVQTGSLSNQVPVISLYNLPMRFRSYEEVEAVREHLDEQLSNSLREKGYEVLGIPALGFAYAMSTREARTVDDARQLKVWTPKGDRLAADVLKAFGIAPVPLSVVDVLTGLQTGLIDTITAPPVSVVALQWHTQIKYLVDVPFMYIYSIFLVDGRRFDSLSVDDQATVKEIFGASSRETQHENIQAHFATMDVLRDRGVEILSLNAEELASWQQPADAESKRWVDEGLLPASVYTKLNEALIEARSN